MVEKYIELIDSKTAAFTSDVVTLSDLVPRQGGATRSTGIPFATSASGTRDAYVNFDTSGGAELRVEASLGNGSDFHEVERITQTGVSQITGYPRMRLKLTNVASGTHSAGLYGDIVREGAFIDILTDLQLASGLKLCLDAGDINSYSGSGQDWVDVSGSGNADEFHLGTGTGVASDDPTFNGTAGGLSSSEYFSSDGGDFFEYGATNVSWMNNLHKNNAKWTIAGWIYVNATGNHAFCDTGNASSGIGIGFFGNITSDTLNITGGNGSILLAQKSSTATFNTSAWNFLAVSVDEAAGVGGSHFYINGAEETFDAVYTSPSASASLNKMHIGSTGAEGSPMPNGMRIAEFAVWEGTQLSATNLDSIYDVTRVRFGV